MAINALMRVLREPSMATLHGKAVAALFDIIKAMGLSFVPYLPKVGGVVGQVWVCVRIKVVATGAGGVQV